MVSMIKSKKMSINVFLCSCILLLLPLYAHSQSDTHKEEVEHAVRVLKGIDKDNDFKWAVATLSDIADKHEDVYAMHALGMAYMSGSGVEKDSLLAIEWLQKACEKNYRLAFHNLGLMYKNGACGVKQDFDKACHYFKAGTEIGSTMCNYDYGYMLFKGLGCKQDYALAAEYFMRDVEKNYKPSLYMLGLCYRNGYGVEKNLDMAKEYLTRAANLGSKAAIEELCREHEENYLHEEYLSDESLGNIPEKMPDIPELINDASFLNGSYTGFIIMYDWSGEYILGEKPTKITINRTQNQAYGNMVFGQDIIPFKANITENGDIEFCEGNIALNERYNNKGKVNYTLQSAKLDIWPTKIQGRLSLYSLDSKEPERPMYIQLVNDEQLNNNNEALNPEALIKTYPNPFISELHVSFDLHEDADARARIFDKYGVCVYEKSLGHIHEGINKATLAPNLKKGSYVLNITAGKQVLRTMIVKNGGE